MTHPPLEDFEAWTLGQLPLSASARFEAHVQSCSACAQRLTVEARLTEALRTAAQPGPTRLAAQLTQRLGAVPARARSVLLVAAAAAAVLVVPREAPTQPSSRPAVKVSVDVRQLGQVPRYEVAMLPGGF